MEGKILVFVKDYQIKVQLMNELTELNIPFVECFEAEELGFKLHLIKSEKRLYIHEYIDAEGIHQFERIKFIKKQGFKVLMIFHEYSIEHIDQCQTAGVDDIVVEPVKSTYLIRKIQTLLNMPLKEEEEIEKTEEELEAEKSEAEHIIQMEIKRANRGKYAISFVLIDFIDLFKGVKKSVKEDVIAQAVSVMRETDILEETEEENQYLLICPFTEKKHLVEVENKIRKYFEEVRRTYKLHSKSKIYVYGLTYGVDGQSFEDILKKLKNSISDSRFLDDIFEQKKIYTPSGMMEYKDLLKKYSS